MSDISVLEGRIAAALARISKAVAERDASALKTGQVTDAELEDRVSALKERQDTQVAKLTARVAAQQDQLLKLDAELQQLRASNAQLRTLNGELRETVIKGIAPELHDAAVAAEIAALQAQRSADAAEVDAILAELTPLIEDARHAAG
ncbi:MAG: hypothetical protein AAGF56_08135 [Pseudomonadota bacterium]